MKTKKFLVLSLFAAFFGVGSMSLAYNSSNESGLSLIDVALAQRLDLGLTPGHGGGGGSSCSGSACDSANGNNYGTLGMSNVTYCCGTSTSSAGNKSS